MHYIRLEKYKLHSVTTGLFVAFGLILSTFSSFDCEFVKVNVGFKPDNTIYQRGKFAIGLWSMEDPTAPGMCLTIDTSRGVGSITREDRYYRSSFLNGDVIWSTARFTAFLGIFFGLVDTITIYMVVFSTDYARNLRKEMILCLSLLTFLCEGLTFGLFFNIEPCTSQFWEQNNTVRYSMVEVVERFEADQCYMDRSTYVSLGALVCYLILIISLTASLVLPDYTHQIVREQRSGGTDLDFDKVSMPFYLDSIGVSMNIVSHLPIDK